jgi:sugar lactone lactonase YvrE
MPILRDFCLLLIESARSSSIQRIVAQGRVGTITNGVNNPSGLAVDGHRNLYVCNINGGYTGNVTVYAPPYTGAPFRKYTDGVPSNVLFATVGADETLYLSSAQSTPSGHTGQVVEYRRGRVHPSRVINLPYSQAAGITTDANNNLYVAYTPEMSGWASVLKFAPGSSQGQDLNLQKTARAGGLAIDHAGNVILVDSSYDVINIYAPGATTPTQTITAFMLPYAITLGKRQSHIYVADLTFSSRGGVYRVAYPSWNILGDIPPGSPGFSDAFNVVVSPRYPLAIFS